MDFGFISFPGLGIDFIDINPVAFSLFGLEIRWYAICITTGLLLAALYALKNCERLGITKDNIIDVVLFGIPASIIGARAYYVLLSLDNFDTFWQVIDIRSGGIAIYGAVIAAFLTGFIYAKTNKVSTLALFDIGALGFLIGQSIGRIGNFINQEAYGGLTDLPWRMEIALGYTRVAVHPTFLYELLWNAVGFAALHFISKKRRFNGEIFFLYVIWYGLGRFWIEGLRTDSLMLFNTIRFSQVLAIVSCIVALGLYIFMLLRTFRKEKTILESEVYKKVSTLFNESNDDLTNTNNHDLNGNGETVIKADVGEEFKEENISPPETNEKNEKNETKETKETKE